MSMLSLFVTFQLLGAENFIELKVFAVVHRFLSCGCNIDFKPYDRCGPELILVTRPKLCKFSHGQIDYFAA